MAYAMLPWSGTIVPYSPMKSLIRPAALGALAFVAVQPVSIQALNFSVRISGPTAVGPAVDRIIFDGSGSDLDPAIGRIRFDFSTGPADLGYTVTGLAIESPGSLTVDGAIGLTLTDLTVTGTFPAGAFGSISAHSDLAAPYSPGGPLFGQAHLTGSYLAGSGSSTDIKNFAGEVFTPIGWQPVGILNPPDASLGLPIDLHSPLTQNFEPTIFRMRATLDFNMINGEGFNLPTSASFSVAGPKPKPIPDSNSIVMLAATFAALILSHSSCKTNASGVVKSS